MARYTGGWIKVWRKMTEGDLPDNIYLWGIWHWLLYTATWKPTKMLWNGQQRELPPGCVVMGLSELAIKWDCSKMTIKRWLDYLEKTERIFVERCTRGTVVTIRNWELYQTDDALDVTPTVRRLYTDCTPTVPYEEGKKKEGKKEEEIQAGANAPACIEKGLPIPKKSKLSDLTRKKMRAFIASYSEGYKKKYGSTPEGLRDKSLIGKIGHWIEHVSEDRAVSLVQVYLQISYRPFDETFHDLWQFFRHLNRIGIALDTGKDANSVDWTKIFGAA